MDLASLYVGYCFKVEYTHLYFKAGRVRGFNGSLGFDFDAQFILGGCFVADSLDDREFVVDSAVDFLKFVRGMVDSGLAYKLDFSADAVTICYGKEGNYSAGSYGFKLVEDKSVGFDNILGRVAELDYKKVSNVPSKSLMSGVLNAVGLDLAFGADTARSLYAVSDRYVSMGVDSVVVFGSSSCLFSMAASLVSFLGAEMEFISSYTDEEVSCVRVSDKELTRNFYYSPVIERANLDLAFKLETGYDSAEVLGSVNFSVFMSNFLNRLSVSKLHSVKFKAASNGFWVSEERWRECVGSGHVEKEVEGRISCDAVRAFAGAVDGLKLEPNVSIRKFGDLGTWFVAAFLEGEGRFYTRII